MGRAEKAPEETQISDNGQVGWKVIWVPQVRQELGAASPADATMFGGTRGGGKTDCLWGRHYMGAMMYGSQWNGLILRRKYKEFGELRRRIDELITMGMPAERIGGDQQVNYVRFNNGAQVALHAVQRYEQLRDFVGQQYTEISIDEGTTFPFFFRMMDMLRGSLRSPHGVPCHLFVTGNPGGPGHQQVKDMFVTPASAETVFTVDGETRTFIPSFLADNVILCKNDPKYVKRLRAIKDPRLRKAWLEGDWDVFIGQAFDFQPRFHVRDAIPIPARATIYTTFDWGYGRPFSWGWWWVDSDSRVYRFSEWYGSTGTPDEGLRITDTEIVQGVIERERKLGISNRRISRLCGHDCFAKKPDYKGGGQGPSTAEIFAQHGIILTKADPDRILKIRRFRERIRVIKDSKGEMLEWPMLVVYPNCKDFIRTIPSLGVDDNNPEDIDTDQEDHCYDEAAQICMRRRLHGEVLGAKTPGGKRKKESVFA